MTKAEKRRLLQGYQAELMLKSDEAQMLVCYGDDFGEPGYCVTARQNDAVTVYWFNHAHTFTGVDEWLERQAFEPFNTADDA